MKLIPTLPKYHPGQHIAVLVTADEVRTFNRTWPCSVIPAVDILFSFDSNGDLTDIEGLPEDVDGPELVALAQDAGMFAKTRTLGA